MQKDHILGCTVTDEGVSFGLWAPFAQEVWLVGDFNDWTEPGYQLEKIGDAWFGTVHDAKVGQEYKYRVLGQDGQWVERNDPRALHITGGNSAIVGRDCNHEESEFHLPPPNLQVIYELHVGTFNRKDPVVSGNFASVMEKLDYLQQLGITTIELLPCSYTTNDRWWGYTPDSLFAIASEYGGRQALCELVQAAHQRGIGVIMDVVFNHMNSAPGVDIWRFDGWYQDDFGGIYFYNDQRAVTPWGNTRLDYGRSEVRDYVLDAIRMLFKDCHIDGLRVDSTHYIRNMEGRNDDPSTDIPDGWRLLQDITWVAREQKGDALLVAEDTASNEYITKPASDGGAGFDAQWETPLPYVFRDILNGLNDETRDLQTLEAAFAKTYNQVGAQKIIFSESHDVDANGRQRLGEEIAPGDSAGMYARRRADLAAALVLTIPGIPMLFQGQEFMQDGSFSHWRELDWDRAATQGGNILLYQDLIGLRKNRDGLSLGLTGNNIKILQIDNVAKTLAYHRWVDDADHGVVVVANFSNTPREQYAVPFPHAGTWYVRFNSDWQGYGQDFTNMFTPEVQVEGAQGFVNLGPYSVVILSQ